MYPGSSVCVVLHLLDSASHESCSTVASAVERNPCISDLHSSDPCCSRVNCIEIDDEVETSPWPTEKIFCSSHRREAVAADAAEFQGEQVAP